MMSGNSAAPPVDIPISPLMSASSIEDNTHHRTTTTHSIEAIMSGSSSSSTSANNMQPPSFLPPTSVTPQPVSTDFMMGGAGPERYLKIFIWSFLYV